MPQGKMKLEKHGDAFSSIIRVAKQVIRSAQLKNAPAELARLKKLDAARKRRNDVGARKMKEESRRKALQKSKEDFRRRTGRTFEEDIKRRR